MMVERIRTPGACLNVTSPLTLSGGQGNKSKRKNNFSELKGKRYLCPNC